MTSHQGLVHLGIRFYSVEMNVNLVCVSLDSTVLAVPLSWSLSPCLEGLKVMGMDDFPLGKWWFGFG